MNGPTAIRNGEQEAVFEFARRRTVSFPIPRSGILPANRSGKDRQHPINRIEEPVDVSIQIAESALPAWHQSPRRLSCTATDSLSNFKPLQSLQRIPRLFGLAQGTLIDPRVGAEYNVFRHATPSLSGLRSILESTARLSRT
jgi:hypothetical protein